MNLRSLVCGGVLCIALLATLAGCEFTAPDREVRMARGHVYYCDGAGAGGLRQGLIDGGYPGAGEIFRWNTGFGVVADQDASVEYKRRKAQEMAQKASEYARAHPGAPVTFIGLSAGTSVVLFSLEELPARTRVEDVVLCGASIRSTY